MYDYIQEDVLQPYFPDSYYDLGNPIEVFYESASVPGELLVVGAGFLSIPVASANGQCNDENYAGFAVQQSETCYRGVPASLNLFSTVCSTQLNSQDFSTNLRVAKYYTVFRSKLCNFQY